MLNNIFPKPIRKRLYRQFFAKSPVLWANWDSFGKYLASLFPMQKPPVLIISMPRSGSSWVGEILGISPGSLYLREPITQTYLKARDAGPSFFEFNEDNLPETYQDSAKNVFAGLPLFNSSITRYPKQWGLLKRKHKRIVAKEVNPFILCWLIKHFQPRIIYLIRHPASVADSFHRLGYNGKQLKPRLSKKTLEKYDNYEHFTDSFWSEHGALQAIILKETMTIAQDYQDFRLVFYEDLCLNTLSAFKKLFDFVELEWDQTIEKQIIQRSFPETVDNHNFSTQRNSSCEVNKWKRQLSENQIQEVKRGWLSFDPPAYKEADWQL